MCDVKLYVRQYVRRLRRRYKQRDSPYDRWETVDLPWYKRYMIKCGELVLFLVDSWCEVLALLVVVALLSIAFTYVFGSHVDEDQLRAAGVIVDALDSPRAYRWLDNQPDSNVSELAVAMRAARFDRSDVLVLVPHTANAVPPAENAVCSTLFSTSADLTQRERYADLIANSERFLLGNQNVTGPTRADTSCVCSPLLGHTLRYIGLLHRRTEQADAEHAGHEKRSVDARYRVEHFFNPVDSLAEAYDALDAAALDEAGVGLATTVETLDYWWNRARGNFTLLRRKTVRFSGYTSACVEESAVVRGATAFCVQRCFDLLGGIDVRGRARRQAAAGVQLNSFDEQKRESAEEEPATSAPTYRDEL